MKRTKAFNLTKSTVGLLIGILLLLGMFLLIITISLSHKSVESQLNQNYETIDNVVNYMMRIPYSNIFITEDSNLDKGVMVTLNEDETLSNNGEPRMEYIPYDYDDLKKNLKQLFDNSSVYYIEKINHTVYFVTHGELEYSKSIVYIEAGHGFDRRLYKKKFQLVPLNINDYYECEEWENY